MLNILVVDDHALVRAGLGQVLQELDDGQPVRVLEAATCAQAFAISREHSDLDLVLLDYHLPDMNGLAALSVWGQTHPELPVVVLSGSANPSIMQRVLAAGASGFVTKSGQSEELLHAVRHVLAGGIYATDRFSQAAQSAGATPATTTPPVFTPRQEAVLHLMMDGCSNQEIALRLGLAPETVKTHISTLLRCLNVKTRTQAVLEASRWGYGKLPVSR